MTVGFTNETAPFETIWWVLSWHPYFKKWTFPRWPPLWIKWIGPGLYMCLTAMKNFSQMEGGSVFTSKVSKNPWFSCRITVLRSCICVLSVVSHLQEKTTSNVIYPFIVRNSSNATIVLRGTVDKLNWKSTRFDTIMWNDAIPWWSVGSVHIVQRFLPDHTTWNVTGGYVWITQ